MHVGGRGTGKCMRIKLFTLRYSATLGGFDETPLLEFLRDKETLSFREHFFLVNEVPHLCCVISYQESAIPSEVLDEARRTSSPGRNGKPDPTAGLDQRERALFETLREWRSTTAREEGVPPYVILTNKQLVAILKRAPDSATALSHVEGIGPATVKKHGTVILELLHGQAVTS